MFTHYFAHISLPEPDHNKKHIVFKSLLQYDFYCQGGKLYVQKNMLDILCYKMISNEIMACLFDRLSCCI